MGVKAGGLHSRVLGSDGHLFLSDDIHFVHQVAMADDLLTDEAGNLDKDRDDYLAYTNLFYERYPWQIGVQYRGITKGFDPILSFIPRRNIFGPSTHALYRIRSSEKWYKNLYAYFRGEYYQDNERQTSLRDYTFISGVDLQNDLGLSVGL